MWWISVYEVQFVTFAFISFSHTQSCWSSQPRDRRDARTRIMSPSMNAWKGFAKCTRSIWRGWTPTVRPSPTTSVSSSTSSTIWQIWAALCTERTHRPTSRTTKTGSKRRFTFYCVAKLSRPPSERGAPLSPYTCLQDIYAESLPNSYLSGHLCKVTSLVLKMGEVY